MSWTVRKNRSMPSATVTPELGYRDVSEAVAWLVATFGFAERLRIADHRAQLAVGDGAMIVTRLPADHAGPSAAAHAVMVRVADVDRHCERAMRGGARILRPPTQYPYGERQYTAVDFAGHVWTFSETVADVDPATWGVTLVAT